MASSSLTQPVKGGRAVLIWYSVACVIALVELLLVIALLRNRYLYYAIYAPGTEIRPIVECGALFVLSIISVLLGGLCVFTGLVISIIRKRWKLALIGVGCGLLTWLPEFVGDWGIHYVMAARKLLWAY